MKVGGAGNRPCCACASSQQQKSRREGSVKWSNVLLIGREGCREGGRDVGREGGREMLND